jgi:endonuclease/exonuclease/phosphatase family metal-dependent hydrolase
VEPAPPVWATLSVASCNLLNLARPHRVFYENQPPFTAEEQGRKLDWLASMFARLDADVFGVQEVWDLSALHDAVGRAKLRGHRAVAPGAEDAGGAPGAQGTPRVGLVSRLPIDELRSIAEFAPGEAVEVPEVGAHARFERPVLHAVLRARFAPRLHVLVVHLKSKRPKFLQDAAGNPTEDRDDPRIGARAMLRSLIMRGAEAQALRGLVLDLLHRTHEPLVLIGDFNDAPASVTSQLVAATSTVAYDRSARDAALWHSWDVQTDASIRRDVAYSHVHQGHPELLDQIWVSEEFVAGSRHAIGDVKRVEVFNDHLNEGRERFRSDHGFVRALLRLRGDQSEASSTPRMSRP